jgi:hypothetical protein
MSWFCPIDPYKSAENTYAAILAVSGYIHSSVHWFMNSCIYLRQLSLTINISSQATIIEACGGVHPAPEPD